MRDFKVGDKIRCIKLDAHLHPGYLTIGKIYTIEKLRYHNIYVTIITDLGVYGEYYSYRFELIEQEPNYIEVLKEF
jgi:hypothetical protein